MIAKMYLKELRQFFRKPFNILFMLVVPIVLILLMGYAMSDIVGGAGETEEAVDAAVFFLIEDGSSSEEQQKFSQFRAYIEKEMGISFEEVSDFKKGCEQVDKQEAIALIRISGEGFYYYRSPYNEPTAGKLLRGVYNTFFSLSEIYSGNSYIETREIRQKTIDSYTYFTFAELGLIMLYIGLIVGQSVFNEKETGTFARIYTSKANISKMLMSKIAMGATVGIVQTALVYMLSVFILHVQWGSLAPLIFVLYLVLSVFSSTLGAIMGLLSKKKASLNDRILTLSILIGFLGGGLTPLSFLDTVRVMSCICKISPLYWITNSAIALSGGTLSRDFAVGVLVCLLLTLLLTGIYLSAKRREAVKGVAVYE